MEYFCWNNSNAGSGAYALWLRTLKDSAGNLRFTGGKLQDYTALTPGLGLIWLILASTLLIYWDLDGAILFTQVFNILGNVLLAVWHIQKEQNGLLGVCNISVGPWLQYYIPGRGYLSKRYS